MSMTTVKLPRLARTDKIVSTGKGYAVQSKGRGKRYKMSKKARDKMAAAARRVKIPVLTLGALALGTWEPIKYLFQGEGKLAGQHLIKNYTGIWIDEGNTHFRFRYLFNGLIPLGAVMLVNRSGLLKPVNQKLAKIKGNPLRLS